MIRQADCCQLFCEEFQSSKRVQFFVLRFFFFIQNRYCGYINLDLLLDLMEVLKSIMKNDLVSIESKLYCIHSSVRSMKSQGGLIIYFAKEQKKMLKLITKFRCKKNILLDTLNIDVKDLFIYLYNLIPPFFSTEKIHKHIQTFVEILQMLFLERKQISLERVAAFVKRLLSYSLFCSPSVILVILLFVAKVFGVCKSFLKKSFPFFLLRKDKFTSIFLSFESFKTLIFGLFFFLKKIVSEIRKNWTID